MILGSHTFASNPSEFSRVYPTEKAVVSGHTLESEYMVDFQFRGDGMVGTRYDLEWKNLSRTEFNLFRAIYEAGGEVTWDPKDWRAHLSTKTYKVIVVDLLCDDYDHTTLYVKNIRLVLEIRSVNP